MARTLHARFLLAAATLATLATLQPPDAAAGEYMVVQCDPLHRGHPDARFDRAGGPYYSIRRACSAPAAPALKIGNLAAAPAGAASRISWMAPSGSRIVAVALQARLRSESGHRARLRFLDGSGQQAGLIATGANEPASFKTYSSRLSGRGREGFASILTCTLPGSCARSDRAHIWIRNLRFTLRDDSAPALAVEGSMLVPGWLRGRRTLGYRSSDLGSGLHRIVVTVNGVPVRPTGTFGCRTVSGGSPATAMRPCPPARSESVTHATSVEPFRDGVNLVRVCAQDYGGGPNLRCIDRRVAIDNRPPEAAFGERTAADPERIEASIADLHSGVASALISYRRIGAGEWTDLPTDYEDGVAAARVDSSSRPRGRYEFRVAGSDRAGNAVVSTRRGDGSEMILDFPLREQTRVSAQARLRGHSYGSRPRLSGRLEAIGQGGDAWVPAAGEELEVVERFSAGADPKRAVHRVRTGPGGRYETRLQAGPSRQVTVKHPGGRRLLPSSSTPRKLVVSGRAGLRLSSRRVKAGGGVRFRGRVGMLGVALPAPGLVVELQAREAGRGRYRTVRQALHINDRGRVRTRYRFGRFYRKPGRFQFRLKLTRQPLWPYGAPTHSRPRSLKVIPRRSQRS